MLTLKDGISIFVEAKHSEGVYFDKEGARLTSFLKRTGNLPLSGISLDHVEAFLDGTSTSAGEWNAKRRILHNFFSYWTVRHEMRDLPMPGQKPREVQTFVPYIYTRDELRRLLQAVPVAQESKDCVMDARTFQVFLLFLYGTGALVGEAQRLLRTDADLKRGFVTLRDSHGGRSRCIPVNPDLLGVLRTYSRLKHRGKGIPHGEFFLTKDGTAIQVITLSKSFERARKIAGVTRSDRGRGRYQPRMHDLRHSFAVHRLTSWLNHRAKVSRLLPALAAYIGQTSLASTESYLRLTPERFKSHLNILSPAGREKHWREDPTLMKFLDRLVQ